MKKIRDVSPRFHENKAWIVSKYREYGIEDGDVWTTSTGEGMSYLNLLKMSFYEDSHKLPENVVIKKGRFVANEKQLNWEDYFTALQKNFQVGITSKAKVSKQIKEKNLKQTQPNANAEDLYEGKIEWDDIQQPSETEKSNSDAKQKYRMHFKQITEIERWDILKEIEKDETVLSEEQKMKLKFFSEKSPNMANFLKSAVKTSGDISETKDFKIMSVEEIENKLVSSDPINRVEMEENTTEVPIEGFFDEDNWGGENQFRVSKENKEAKGCEEEIVEFDNINVFDLKMQQQKIGDLAILSKPIQEEPISTSENAKKDNAEENTEADNDINVISAEELDKMQTQSVLEHYDPELSMSQKQTEMKMNY